MLIETDHLWDDVPANVPTLLVIDLESVVANWQRIQFEVGQKVEVAAVVKANAYGFGMIPVATALAAAGCRLFFTAHLEEALSLRAHLTDSAIAVLHGPMPGTEDLMAAERLIPVLNSRKQVDAWLTLALRLQATPPAMLHVDTGMNRLGLPMSEFSALLDQPSIRAYPWLATISHLACADQPDHWLNNTQLKRFFQARALLPGVPAGISASSGVFLGPSYHGDLVRPGLALYGGNPCPSRINPMRQAVRLSAKILQCRAIDSSDTVGYGATHRSREPAVAATVAVGYADGFPRSSSGVGAAYYGDVALPIIGRISMDLMTLDITALPCSLRCAGTPVDILCPHRTLDDLAKDAGTVGYEIMTALGSRYHRKYLKKTAPTPLVASI